MLPTRASRALADLIRLRQENGISLAAIAASTKISTRYLEAIEAGRFRNLPGGIYGLSYIRQYADAISGSGDELVMHYRDSILPEGAPVDHPDRFSERIVRLRNCIFRGAAARSQTGGHASPPETGRSAA